MRQCGITVPFSISHESKVFRMSFAETFYIFQKDQPVSEMDPPLRGTVANMGVTFKGPGIEAGIKTSGSSGIERAEGHIRGVISGWCSQPHGAFIRFGRDGKA